MGPNNSGKSALLEALFKSLVGEQINKPCALASFSCPPFKREILEEREDFAGKDDDESVSIDNYLLTVVKWCQLLGNTDHWHGLYGGKFRSPFCIWMNGTTRLSMLPDEQNPNLQTPTSSLAKLFNEDEIRAEFQSTVFDGIGHYPFIDRMSKYGNLKIAFSTTKPRPDIERGADNKLSEFLKKSITREMVSDGFNAYVGMIGSLFSKKLKCIMIDEPEAFLHPALARTLGKQVALQAKEKQVFIASHSSEFLMGAIESGTPVRIVRLQYQNGLATACLLDGTELKSFMQDPLLRSANVLSGLFAKSVVVGEADTDRAFYQEINTRLLSTQDERGIENCIFLNAQNKQTVPRIVKLLRKMGVPAVGVLDLDIFSEGGSNWRKQVDAIGFPKTIKRGLETQRKDIFDQLQSASTDKNSKNYKINGGISLLDGDGRESAEMLIKTLEDYGLFVVPNGEVEAWLANLKASTSKDKWLHEIFEKLGSDSMSSSYAKPGEGDVWDFIGQMNQWLTDPKKKGMRSG